VAEAADTQAKAAAAVAVVAILLNRGAGILIPNRLEQLDKEMLAVWAVWAEPVEVAQVRKVHLARHRATAMGATVETDFQIR
jgi:hypothetical protein